MPLPACLRTPTLARWEVAAHAGRSMPLPSIANQSVDHGLLLSVLLWPQFQEVEPVPQLRRSFSSGLALRSVACWKWTRPEFPASFTGPASCAWNQYVLCRDRIRGSSSFFTRQESPLLSCACSGRIRFPVLDAGCKVGSTFVAKSQAFFASFRPRLYGRKQALLYSSASRNGSVSSGANQSCSICLSKKKKNQCSILAAQIVIINVQKTI